MNSDQADLVIVGGGVIGLSVAWAMRGTGKRILVIDRQAVGREASWAGGGILSPLPPGGEDPRLSELLARSLSLFPVWCEELEAASDIDPCFWRCGARYFSPMGVRELPDIAQIRNPRLLRAAATAVRRSGVTVREGTGVSGWLTHGDRLTGVQLDNGDRVRCEQAVLCAGAWSSGLGLAGVRPIKGEMLLFRDRPGRLDQILIGESIYLIPRQDGHILVGSTVEDVGFDQVCNPARAAELIGAAAKIWPQISELAPIRQWCGLRPGSADGIPTIAEMPMARGLFACSGHFRIGLTLAPASAELVRALLLGLRPPVDPSHFSMQ